MPYTPLEWKDGPEGGTPISAANLNRMEQGIKDAHDLAEEALEERASFAVGTARLPAGSTSPLISHSLDTTALVGVSLMEVVSFSPLTVKPATNGEVIIEATGYRIRNTSSETKDFYVSLFGKKRPGN